MCDLVLYIIFIMAERYNKILIVKPSSLGDVIMTLPALSAIRRSYPDATISWLIRPEFSDLIRGNPYLDEIINFDRKFLAKAVYKPSALAAIFELIKKLRRSKFDVVFDFQGLFRTASLSFLSGSPVRYGLSNSREFAPLFYTHKAPVDPNRHHIVEMFMDMLEFAGIAAKKVEFTLPIDSDAEGYALDILRSSGVEAGQYAVFIPGSAHKDKCWPAENYSRMAEKIDNELGVKIVATGSASEAAIIENIKSKTNVEILNLAGKTNLRQLIYVVKGARLVVSNDTGPGHIAAIMGRPMVMIFGWSNPQRVSAYGRGDTIVAIDQDSRNGIIKSKNPTHHIKNITFEEVSKKLDQQLRQGAMSVTQENGCFKFLINE